MTSMTLPWHLKRMKQMPLAWCTYLSCEDRQQWVENLTFVSLISSGLKQTISCGLGWLCSSCVTGVSNSAIWIWAFWGHDHFFWFPVDRDVRRCSFWSDHGPNSVGRLLGLLSRERSLPALMFQGHIFCFLVEQRNVSQVYPRMFALCSSSIR